MKTVSWWRIGLSILGLAMVVIFGDRFGSHPWPGFGASSGAVARHGEARRGAGVKVTESIGPNGHRSVGIDSSSIGEAAGLLPFSELAQWDFSVDRPASAPAAIEKLHGSSVTLIGFMFPLSEGEAIKAFCLMATTQTCCYGPKPQFNQFVLVETPVPIAFERMRPVRVMGTFFVEPRPQDGYIYRLTATSVLPAGNQMFAVASATPGLPVFRWNWMDGLKPPGRPKSLEEMVRSMHVPAAIASLSDAEITISGYIAGRVDLPTSGDCWIVARDFWDGCCVGVPPSPFNAIPTRLASTSAAPEPWLQQARFTGRLKIRDPKDWGVEGMLFLADAQLIGPADGTAERSQE